MDDGFIEDARQRLVRRAAELRKTIGHIKDETGPVAPDNAIGRLTRLDAMQAASMRTALGREHEVELRHVDRALDAIAGGEYGSCRRCKGPISEARLRAKPEAFICLACADTAR